MNGSKKSVVIVSGGTSGLGKAIVAELEKRNQNVIVLGRSANKEANTSFIGYVHCDYSSFDSVQKTFHAILKEDIHVKALVNNAGILSPPSYQYTEDGFEKSYQINFLSHVLLTHLLYEEGLLRDATVINISSPIYRRGRLPIDLDTNSYSSLKAYANSKLYLAFFSKLLAQNGIASYSFNPGTFRSGIYRTQNRWFHVLYKVAAPFMTGSSAVAKQLLNTLEDRTVVDGRMLDKFGKENRLTVDERLLRDFWLEVQKQLKITWTFDGA
jgi:NAD(P)-dependent dehydrogenase (short-subunit alcohol dehydrogenase family)